MQPPSQQAASLRDPAWLPGLVVRRLWPGLGLPFSIQAQDAPLTNTWGQRAPWERAKNSTTGNGEASSKSSGTCFCSSMGLKTHGWAPEHSLLSKNKCGGLGGLLLQVGSCTVVRSHRNSLSRGLGPPSHPHVHCRLSSHPRLTNSRCFPTFLNLK